jgi:hypothetical protein
VTLSDIIFVGPVVGWLHNPNSKFGEEEKRFCFMPTKCMELLSMVDIAMDRLHVAKKEQLLAERKRRNQILVRKIQMLNLIARNHYVSQSTLQASYFDDISSSSFAKGSSKSNLLNV